MLSAKNKKLLASWGISIEAGAVKVDLSKIGINEKDLLAAANDAAEVDIEIAVKPEGFNILDDAALKEFEGRIKTEQKPLIENATKEILAKIWKEKYGVKLDTKNPDEVLEAIILAKSTAAVDAAKLTVDEQVRLKEADLESVRANYKELEKELNKEKEEVTAWKGKHDLVLENQDFASLLGDKVNPLLKPSEYRARMLEEEGIQFKKVAGVWKVLDSEGNPVKNKLRDEISATEKLNEILSKRTEWAKPTTPSDGGGNNGGGHGTGNSGGGAGGNGGAGSASIKNMSSFKEAARTNKWNAVRQNQEYLKVVAENKDFDPNS